ncbi:hypothetical protein AABB24_017149, partial [Solanum stoloniferum]
QTLKNDFILSFSSLSSAAAPPLYAFRRNCPRLLVAVVPLSFSSLLSSPLFLDEAVSIGKASSINNCSDQQLDEVAIAASPASERQNSSNISSSVDEQRPTTVPVLSFPLISLRLSSLSPFLFSFLSSL